MVQKRPQPAKASPHKPAPPASSSGSSGAAPRARSTCVDLGKLRKTSLKRYKKYFKLDVKADSKHELLAAVSAHFAAMPVREAVVALEFQQFAKMTRMKARAAASAAAAAAPQQPPAAPTR